jgi:hypothetical protein
MASKPTSTAARVTTASKSGATATTGVAGGTAYKNVVRSGKLSLKGGPTSIDKTKYKHKTCPSLSHFPLRSSSSSSPSPFTLHCIISMFK